MKDNEGLFKGFTYNRLSREYEWFDKQPALITPFELLKWAIFCGGWTLHDDETHGELFWLGPAGPTPWVGSYKVPYMNDDTALQVMRAHYAHWWGQRETVKKAFEAMDASQDDSKKDKPPEFKITDEDEDE